MCILRLNKFIWCNKSKDHFKNLSDVNAKQINKLPHCIVIDIHTAYSEHKSGSKITFSFVIQFPIDRVLMKAETLMLIPSLIKLHSMLVNHHVAISLYYVGQCKRQVQEMWMPVPWVNYNKSFILNSAELLTKFGYCQNSLHFDIVHSVAGFNSGLMGSLQREMWHITK